tara:strand:- start:496 stop:885 length:390 start_codon:yes stop_codon:yes gene_type:complete
VFKNSVFFRGEKVAIHPNSLKNLRGGRKKGSKNKTTLAKKDIEKLLETQEDIKEKAEKINLSKDDLVEVLVASKESKVSKNKVEGKEKIKKPNKTNPTPSIQDNNLSTNNLQDVDNSPRTATWKEFFFG